MDISYRNEGLFTSFFPETKTGEVAWRELYKGLENSHKVLSIQAVGVIRQLRKAGYKVGKARPVAMNDDQLLNELFN